MPTDSELCEQEHELMYYGFNSNDVFDDLKECVEIKLWELLNDLQLVLEAKGINRQLVKHQIRNLYDLYMEKCKKPLLKFKKRFEEISRLPNVLVGENVPMGDADVENLEEEVAELERKLIAEKLFHSELQRRQKQVLAIESFINETEVLLSEEDEQQKTLEQIQKTLKEIKILKTKRRTEDDIDDKIMCHYSNLIN